MSIPAAVAVDTTVPWIFSQAGAFSQWLWHTRDFDAVVVCDGGLWSWEVKTAAAVPIGAGPADDFDACADLALEAVGKGFPTSAGYSRWVGSAARKYALSNGVRVDLSAGEGKSVRVTLVDGRTVDGVLHLGDWLLHVVDDGVQRDVHPQHVTRVDRLA